MLSSYGKREWMVILVVAAMLVVTFLIVDLWWLALLTLAVAAALCAFFRDPERRTPTQRNIMVSPADGRISSIHHVENFEPLQGPATCVRIFLSVLDAHINRSPCHGEVHSITHKPGEHLNVLNPRSAEVNESNLIVLLHPTRRYPMAAVRQVAGLLARTIACGIETGQILQRGQRIGMIKLGSTTELYVPQSLQPQVLVEQGQKVAAGLSLLVRITPQAGDGDTAENNENKTVNQNSNA